MAHAAILNTPALNAIAQQIGELLRDVAEPALLNAQPIELRETLEVWALGLDALAYGSASGKRLSQLARPTGRWHHQITFDGNAAAFARSSASGAGSSSIVEELFMSPLAAKLDAAMEWIDQNVSGDPMVHLLVVPAYYLHALWLTGNANQSGHILVIEQAGTSEVATDDTGALLQNALSFQLLDEQTFLQSLASIPAPVGVLLGGIGSGTPTLVGVP